MDSLSLYRSKLIEGGDDPLDYTGIIPSDIMNGICKEALDQNKQIVFEENKKGLKYYLK